MKKIISLHHPLVKHLVKLREKKRYREEEGTALVSGNKVVLELGARIRPHRILCHEDFSFVPPADVECLLVTESILKKVTGLLSPEPLAAEFPLPAPSSLLGTKKIVACDRIADPGNLGTLIRSALAFDFEGIFLFDHTVDLFNDKVIRASRGASFLLPFTYGTIETLKELLKKNSMELLIADTEGEDLSTLRIKNNKVLLLGSEASGPTKELKELGRQITIPISKNMESLNVACAGSIVMYALSL